MFDYGEKRTKVQLSWRCLILFSQWVSCQARKVQVWVFLKNGRI